MRMYGSVLPQMLLPLFFVGSWATCITCISKFVSPRKFASVESAHTFSLSGLTKPILSRCTHRSPHSPRFRRRSRPLVPQHHSLRALLRRPQILDPPLCALPQPRPLHLGAHRRALRLPQRRSPLKSNSHKPPPRLRRIPQTPTTLRTLRPLPGHRVPHLALRHFRKIRT